MKYDRYQIIARSAPNIAPFPQHFNVRVNRLALAKFLLKELWQYRGKLNVVKSRPCIYGVFSGPFGGFMPREELCVGCLRCTTQYPDIVRIYPNPKRQLLGDHYFKAAQVATVIYEAEGGRIPIKGAGYRGTFGGDGWDGLWTDMSEIVRPTRDGIHGREFISTAIELGERPSFLQFDKDGVEGKKPHMVSLPVPLLIDLPAKAALHNPTVCAAISRAAQELESFAIFPAKTLISSQFQGKHLIPHVAPDELNLLEALSFEPLFIELSSWNKEAFKQLQQRFPHALILIRTPFEAASLLKSYHEGARLFHCTTNYHGRGPEGKFVKELIREAHLAFVQEGCRDQVCLIGSGGMIAAEHIPKAMMCGLDAIALDTPILVALQAEFKEECVDRENSQFVFPRELSIAWGSQRIKNLFCAWRDQLLEILGAMGLREVRRLRGEMGRALLQENLEAEAFSDIEELK